MGRVLEYLWEDVFKMIGVLGHVSRKREKFVLLERGVQVIIYSHEERIQYWSHFPLIASERNVITKQITCDIISFGFVADD